jgi:hypothetical protein
MHTMQRNGAEEEEEEEEEEHQSTSLSSYIFFHYLEKFPVSPSAVVIVTVHGG